MENKNFLVLLAKKAVENYCEKKEKISPPPETPKEFLDKKAGVFVSIKKNGQLRGCVGTYLPVHENIAKETIENAILAGFFDDRFPSISKEELPFLSFTVYVLNQPELIDNINQLDPKKYGILIKSISSNKSALLLPDLEGVDSIEEQILITCQKGNIDLEKEKIIIYRFTAQKYEDNQN